MRCAVIVLVSSLVAGATARAMPRDIGEEKQEARDHYEKGLAHYNLGEFPGAIDEFKRAYEISKAPKLLFNLAQAQRLNKNYEEALYSYTTYLRLVPDAPNRVDVASRIAEMSRLLKEDRDRAPPPREEPAPPPVEPPPPVVPAPPPVVVTTPPPPPPPPLPPPSRALLYTGIGVAAGGVALLAVAAGFTGAAASAGDELRALQSSHGMWSPHHQAVFDDGQRYQAAAVATWAIGGAAAVAGGVLAIVGARRARRVQVGVVPGAAAVSWSGTW